VKTTIVVSDCLRYGFVEKDFPNDFIFHNHHTIHGFTGPSFINLTLSQTDTAFPSRLTTKNRTTFKRTRPDQPIMLCARRYPKDSLSFCKEFNESMFITQHPAFHPIDGHNRVAEKYISMSYECDDRWRLSDLIDVGIKFLSKASDDSILYIWSVETHGNPRRMHYPKLNEVNAIKASVKYTMKVIQPLIKASDIFMLTSDHGERWCPETSEWRHPPSSTRKIHPEQFHIPWIITGIGTGDYRKETSILDIAPTIYYLNNKPVPERFEGKVIPIGNFI